VLVDSQYRARLTDFGLAITIYATVTATTTGRGVGTTRYMAPELFEWDLESNEGGKPTKQTDVYALGISVWQVCLCLTLLVDHRVITHPQIYSEHVPFAEIPSDIAVTRRVLSGARPSCSSSMFERGMSPAIWLCITQWWTQAPEERPILHAGEDIMWVSASILNKTDFGHRSARYLAVKDLSYISRFRDGIALTDASKGSPSFDVRPREEHSSDGTSRCWIGAGIGNNIWQGTVFKLVDSSGLVLATTVAVEVMPYSCLAALPSGVPMSLKGVRASVIVSAGPLKWEIRNTNPSSWITRDISALIARAAIRGADRAHRSVALAEGGLGESSSTNVGIHVYVGGAFLEDKVLLNFGGLYQPRVSSSCFPGLFHAIARVHDLLSLESPITLFAPSVHISVVSGQMKSACTRLTDQNMPLSVASPHTVSDTDASSLTLVLTSELDREVFPHIVLLDTSTCAITYSGARSVLSPAWGHDTERPCHLTVPLPAIPANPFMAGLSKNFLLKIFLTSRATSLAHTEQDAVFFASPLGVWEARPLDELKYAGPRGGVGLAGTQWDVTTKTITIEYQTAGVATARILGVRYILA
jgi:serine/threonine protein kinase